MPIMSKRYNAKEKITEIKIKLITNVKCVHFSNVTIHEFDKGISIHINLGYGQYTEEIYEIMNFLDKFEFFDHHSALLPIDKYSYGESFVTYVKDC